MLRTLLLAGLALGALPGCWTNACVLGPAPPDQGACQEELDGLFFSDATDSQGRSPWCTGEPHLMSRCASLGYTQQCDSFWVRPGSPEAQYCP